jgi:hypothetical protein
MFRIEDTSAPATCAPPRSPPKSKLLRTQPRQRKRPKRLGAPRLNRTGSNEKHLGLPCRHRLRAWSATSALAPPAFITNTGKVPSIRRGCRRPQCSSFRCRSLTPSNSTTASIGLPTAEAFRASYRPMFATHTIPLRNSSSGYFVPRHSIPSFHNVRIIERKSV